MDFYDFLYRKSQSNFFSKHYQLKKHNSGHIELLDFPDLEADLNINLRCHYRERKKVEKSLKNFPASFYLIFGMSANTDFLIT